LQAAANAATWGADPSTNFVVGGSSAGGNLSAVLSLLARDHKLSPPLTGVSLQYPLVVHPQAVPEEFKKDYHSYEQNADVEGILNKTVMDFLIRETHSASRSGITSYANPPFRRNVRGT
jgi:acetyl esterase/lipase